MSFVAANGLSFHVQRLGEGPGTPVAMVHGLLLGSLASWYFTTAPVLARGREVLLYDLRGHGRSERVATGYDVGTMTSDLAALTADRADRPIDVVGHSWGALIALRLAIEHPARVRRMVLVDAPLPPSSVRQFDEFSRRTPQDMIDALPGELRELLLRGKRQARRWLESLSFLIQQTDLTAAVEAEPDVPDEVLARVSCPTLLAYGLQSACRPVGDRLARVMPDAHLAVLPGGHYLHLDAATQLTARITEFLDG